MASLLIRDLDNCLHARIKQCARANRRSMAAEAEEMLRRADIQDSAVGPQETLYDIAWRLFGPHGGVELDLPPRGDLPSRAPPDFTGMEFES